MKEKKIFSHHAFYFFETLMILTGIFFMLVVSYSIILQFLVLVFLLLSYIVLGFIHHFINHDLRAKIVLEYILISALILVSFLFFNSGRL